MPTATELEKQNEAEAAEKAKAEAEKLSSAEAEKKLKESEETWYNQEQVDKLTQIAASKSGDKRKEVEEERDNFKSQLATKESELGGIQDERDSLQTQIEGLTENDPKKFDLIKRDKELRERERQHKANLRTLEEDRTKVNARADKADAFDLEVLMETIADDHEDGDKAKLKSACEKVGAKTEDAIRNVAKILWPGGEPLKPFSGKTRGGSTYFTRAEIADRAFWEANKDDILLAEKEGRIRE